MRSSQNCPARFLIVLTLLRLKTLKVSLCKILHRGQRHFGEGPPTADSQRYGRISGRYFKVARAAEQWSRIGVVRRERVPHAEAVELYVTSGAWCPRPRRVRSTPSARQSLSPVVSAPAASEFRHRAARHLRAHSLGACQAQSPVP